MKSKITLKLAAFAVELMCLLLCGTILFTACNEKTDNSQQKTHVDIIVRDPQSGEEIEFNDWIIVPVAESNEVACVSLKVSEEDCYLSDADFFSGNMKKHLKLYLEEEGGGYHEQESWDFWPNEVGIHYILITFNDAAEYLNENDPQYYPARILFVLQLV